MFYSFTAPNSKEQAQAALEQERAGKERLAAWLRQLGIDPDE